LKWGKKLEKVKHINRKLALTIIAVLLISSSLVLLKVNTAAAQTTTPTADEMLRTTSTVGPSVRDMMGETLGLIPTVLRLNDLTIFGHQEGQTQGEA
jgi:hypothetical protein